jgi:modulator of FtsH protease HflC
MKLLTSPVAIIITLLVAFLVYNSAFTVSESEQVFVTEFGKIVGDPINSDPNKTEAGLHFKKPFLQQVNRLEKRILEWDGPATEMPTRDKLYISVDNFARWRINDPKTFFEKLRDERSALSRLDTIIGSETRNVIASHDLIEVIRSDKNRKPIRDETLALGNSNIGVLPAINIGRKALDQQIFKAAEPKVKSLGIELLEVRFKRINYKAEVVKKIYDRMASERKQIADRFRSEGAGEAAKIIGTKERDLLSIESEAYRKEQEIKGKADAQATGIYAEAYNSSSSAADFYQFVKTLETYSKTIDKETTAVFTTDNDLFRLMKKIDPVKTPAAQ